ncbi:MAG: S-layer homology domain-containing protein [Bacillota bacterium]
MLLKMKNNKLISGTIMVIFIGVLVLFSFSQTVWASSSTEIYQEIKLKYPNEIKTLKLKGVTDNNILNFIAAVENELKKKTTLTDENFNDAMMDAIVTLYLGDDHNAIFDAVFEGWNLSFDVLMDAFEKGGTAKVLDLLPESFIAMGRMVKDKIVVPNDPSPSNPGGTGGGTNPSGNGNTTVPEQNKTFIDISHHWARTDIEFLAARGIVNGVGENIFEPGRQVTRAEFVTMLVNTLGITAKKETAKKFTDVTPGAWYAGSIYCAYESGLVRGVGENIFAPKQYITRQEIAVMIINALKFKGISLENNTDDMAGELNTYLDKSQIASWAEEALAQAIKTQIILGRSDKYLAPRDNANRAEAAVMIKRLYQKIQ